MTQGMREAFHSKMSSHRGGLLLETLPRECLPRGSAETHWLILAAVSADIHSEEHLDAGGGQRPEQEQATVEVSLTTASGFQ